MGNGPEFFQTRMGQKFYDVTMLGISASLKTIADELKRANDLKEQEILKKDSNLKIIIGEEEQK